MADLPPPLPLPPLPTPQEDDEEKKDLVPPSNPPPPVPTSSEPVLKVPEKSASSDTKRGLAPTPNRALVTSPSKSNVPSIATERYVKISHRALSNNPTFADVNLIVGKKTIYAHSYILNLRAPKLIELKGAPIKKKKDLITREMNKDVRENILLVVLDYVYTDEIDFSTLSVPDILSVNAYAYEFDIPRLIWLCENHLLTMLNTDNVYEVLIESNRFNQEKIKNFCFHFVANNYDSFVANKVKTSQMGMELFQDAIAFVNSIKDRKPLETKECPPSTLRDDFKKLYEVTLKERSGAYDPKKDYDTTPFRVGINLAVQYPAAHRAILAGHTPALNNLCSSAMSKDKAIGEYIVVPPLRTRSVFDNISQEAFDTLLKFVYYGDTDVPCLHACELIPFTVDYGMSELQSICYRKIADNINDKTALPVLGVCYIQAPQGGGESFTLLATRTSGDPSVLTVENTRKAAVDHILNNLAESDLSLLPRMFPIIAVDLVVANQRKERIAKGMSVESEKEKKGADTTPPTRPLAKSPSSPKVADKAEGRKLEKSDSKKIDKEEEKKKEKEEKERKEREEKERKEKEKNEKKEKKDKKEKKEEKKDDKKK